MGEILCVQKWPRKSGIPEDSVDMSWVFHYGTGAPDAAAFDAIAALLDDFWTNTPTGGTSAPQNYLNLVLSNNADAVVLEFYDITSTLDGSPHGSPVGMRTLSLVPGGSGTMPSEVCSVLSYKSPYGTDVEFGAGALRPRSRDRGRIYIGPLAGSAFVVDTTTKEALITPQCRDDFVAAAADLAGDHTTVAWGQWSRAKAEVALVDEWWMDNACDIQRRRGIKATARSSGSV